MYNSNLYCYTNSRSHKKICEGGSFKNSIINSAILFFFFLFLIFSHFFVGSMCLMRRLNLVRSCASSLDNSLSDKWFLILSNYLRFGLPLLLFPGTSIAITLLPTYSSSLRNTCPWPYHFNLLSCTFLDISPTFGVPLILPFLILSSLVTPLIHLNIGILIYLKVYCKTLLSQSTSYNLSSKSRLVARSVFTRDCSGRSQYYIA